MTTHMTPQLRQQWRAEADLDPNGYHARQVIALDEALTAAQATLPVFLERLLTVLYTEPGWDTPITQERLSYLIGLARQEASS